MEKTTETIVENSADAEEALSAVLKWAAGTHRPVAILVRRCLLRLRAPPGRFH